VIIKDRSWQLLEERTRAEESPRVRAHIALVVEHIRAEAAGDIDRVMATLAPDPTYIFFDGSTLETLTYRGLAEVRRFYEQFQASVSPDRELAVDQITADEGCVVTALTTKTPMYGRALAVVNMKVDDPDALYLRKGRSTVVWPFDANGLLLGEHVYRAAFELSKMA
jgi:hypothetical protein